jgi:hypothetical protein
VRDAESRNREFFVSREIFVPREIFVLIGAKARLGDVAGSLAISD